MIFTRDFVTRKNHWQIASLVTRKSLFTVTHALFLISCLWYVLLLLLVNEMYSLEMHCAYMKLPKQGLQGWGGGGGVLGQVSDRDAPQRPSTRNATRVEKGGRNYAFCPILMKNGGRNTFSSFLLKCRGQNTTFFSFLLKYRGRNYTIFQRPEKGGSKWRSIYSNLHRVSTFPGSLSLDF